MLRRLAVALTAGLAWGCSSDDGPKTDVLMVQECISPAPPPIPDGREASTEQMRHAKAAVEGFIAAGRDFQSCTDDLARILERDEPDRVGEAAQRRLQMEAAIRGIADRYNQELRAFKGRGSDPIP